LRGDCHPASLGDGGSERGWGSPCANALAGAFPLAVAFLLLLLAEPGWDAARAFQALIGSGREGGRVIPSDGVGEESRDVTAPGVGVGGGIRPLGVPGSAVTPRGFSSLSHERDAAASGNAGGCGRRGWRMDGGFSAWRAPVEEVPPRTWRLAALTLEIHRGGAGSRRGAGGSSDVEGLGPAAAGFGTRGFGPGGLWRGDGLAPGTGKGVGPAPVSILSWRISAPLDLFDGIWRGGTLTWLGFFVVTLSRLGRLSAWKMQLGR